MLEVRGEGHTLVHVCGGEGHTLVQVCGGEDVHVDAASSWLFAFVTPNLTWILSGKLGGTKRSSSYWRHWQSGDVSGHRSGR